MTDATPATPSGSAVLIAQDEADTIGDAVSALSGLVRAGRLGAVLVVDGGSTDHTVAVARAAGAEVHAAADLVAGAGPVLGKGDSIWRALTVVETELVAFLDADLVGPYHEFAARLLAPLEADAGIRFVKGRFRRTRLGEVEPRPFDGGRVTELVARPLLNLLRPELARFYQPLSGQVAGRTADLRSIPVLTGYAVEIAMLAEVVDRWGVDAVAEADLGPLVNRERPVEDLAPMAQEVLYGLLHARDPALAWSPYVRPGSDGRAPVVTDHTVVRRPPHDT